MNQQVKTRNLKKKNTKPNDIVDKKKQGLRNRETNVISFIFVALFLMMASYLVYFNVFEASTIVNNPYNKRIDNLENKIPAKQWSVIDAVRRLGNIGAHMEKDINLIIEIDPGEAEKLINLIELLLNQWYIDRYEQEQLYNDILSINETKQTERKQTE